MKWLIRGESEKVLQFNKKVLYLIVPLSLCAKVEAELNQEQLEKASQVCDSRLGPDERVSLWLTTGSTQSATEIECAARITAEQLRQHRDKQYFIQQVGDNQYRHISENSPRKNPITKYSFDQSTAKQSSRKSNIDATKNALPTLRKEGYKSIK